MSMINEHVLLVGMVLLNVHNVFNEKCILMKRPFSYHVFNVCVHMVSVPPL